MEAWTKYFDSVSQFLESMVLPTLVFREYGITDVSFCEYILLQLEIFINTCIKLSDVMETFSSDDNEEVQVIS